MLERTGLAIMRLPGATEHAVHSFLIKNLKHDPGELPARADAALAAIKNLHSAELRHGHGESATDGAETSGKTQRVASKFLREYNLAHWVEKQNLDLGMAPFTANVMLAARREQVLLPNKQHSRKGQKQFLRRWRRRWSIKLGAIACREVMTKETLQAKEAQQRF
jgi:hypothetical protein